MSGILMRACILLLTFFLWTVVTPLLAEQETLLTGEEMVASDTEPDPLVLERDALREKARALSATAQSFGERQNALRLELREAAKASRSLADVETEDEETIKLTLRLKELETELQEVREALRFRLRNDPDLKAQQARVKTISDAMRELRAEREAFEKAGTATMRRLKIVEDELAKRERAAAEAALDGASTGEGESPANQTNGVRSVSEQNPGTGAEK